MWCLDSICAYISGACMQIWARYLCTHTPHTHHTHTHTHHTHTLYTRTHTRHTHTHTTQETGSLDWAHGKDTARVVSGDAVANGGSVCGVVSDEWASLSFTQRLNIAFQWISASVCGLRVLYVSVCARALKREAARGQFVAFVNVCILYVCILYTCVP